MIKVFDLTWNHFGDYLKVCGPGDIVIKRFDVTKRHVISEVFKVYDPLDLVAPVVFQGKVFLQKLWTIELGWVDTIFCQSHYVKSGRDDPHTSTIV